MPSQNTLLLLSRYLDGETSEEESKSALELVAADKEAAGELREMEQISRAVDLAVESLNPPDSFVANVMFKVSAEKARAKTAPRPEKKKSPVRTIRWIAASVAAAAAALLAVLIVPGLFEKPSQEPTPRPVAAGKEEPAEKPVEMIAVQLEGPVKIVAENGASYRVVDKQELVSNSTINTEYGRAEYEIEKRRFQQNSSSVVRYLYVDKDSVNLVLEEGQLNIDCKPGEGSGGVVVQTALGTVKALDATFDTRIENLPEGAYGFDAAPNDYNYDSVILTLHAEESPRLNIVGFLWHATSEADISGGAIGPIYAGPSANGAPPAPAAVDDAGKKTDETKNAATPKPARLTITVSRGSVEFFYNGKVMTLSAPSELVRDTAAPPNMQRLEQKEADARNNWWNDQRTKESPAEEPESSDKSPPPPAEPPPKGKG